MNIPFSAIDGAPAHHDGRIENTDGIATTAIVIRDSTVATLGAKRDTRIATLQLG